MGQRRRSLVAAVLVLTLAGSSTMAPPAGAQARAVLVSVRTTPQLAQPGDDVTAHVSIQGCPPGPAVAELYLETDDGVSRTTELMAREPIRTSMVWTSRAQLRLDDALPAWYGVRVVCGTFRPPREPLTNTRFVVGAKPAATFAAAAPSVAAGSTISLAGTGCRGDSIDAQLLPSADAVEPYVADGEATVGPDGTWSVALDVAAGTRPGRVALRARCRATNQYGRRVAIPYEDRVIVTVTP